MDLADLEDAMACAVEAHDFETADALRDRLTELRASGEAAPRRRQVKPEGWSRPPRDQVIGPQP